MIIGLTGGMVCGKASMAKLLVEKGFIPLVFSDVINEELIKRGIPITRKSQQDFGNELRETFGAGEIARRLIARIEKASSETAVSEKKGKNYVLDGIRNPGEVEVLRQSKDFFLIAIESSQENRFKRIIERNMDRDPKTWEEFLAADSRDFDDGTEHGLQIKKCMKLADYTIENNGSFDDFKNKIEDVLKKIS